MEEAERVLGVQIERTISYNPQAALVEKLFTLSTHSPGRISTEYGDLLQEIQKRNLDGLDTLIAKAEKACENDDEDAADKIRSVLLDDFSDRADAMFCVGQIERRFRGREQALPFWRRALDSDPLHRGAFKALSAYLKQKDDRAALLRLHEARIQRAQDLQDTELTGLYREHAEELMSLSRYEEAARTYDKSLDDSLGLARLGALFNACEARRRAGEGTEIADWTRIIDIFEKESKLENCDLSSQANIWQAMHVAYACIGAFPKAQDALAQAEKCALSAGKTEEIFSVKTYTDLTVQEFIGANEEMRNSLNTGRLWDGMKVPVGTGSTQAVESDQNVG